MRIGTGLFGTSVPTEAGRSRYGNGARLYRIFCWFNTASFVLYGLLRNHRKTGTNVSVTNYENGMSDD